MSTSCNTRRYIQRPRWLVVRMVSTRPVHVRLRSQGQCLHGTDNATGNKGFGACHDGIYDGNGDQVLPYRSRLADLHQQGNGSRA